jgi:hypothetical protein
MNLNQSIKIDCKKLLLYQEAASVELIFVWIYGNNFLIITLRLLYVCKIG